MAEVETKTQETKTPVVAAVATDGKGVFAGKKGKESETPGWLKSASKNAGTKIADVSEVEGQGGIKSFRQEKPTDTELGLNPGTRIEVAVEKKVVQKADIEAAKKMLAAGFDPKTGKKLDEKELKIAKGELEAKIEAESDENVEADTDKTMSKGESETGTEVEEKKGILNNLKSLFATRKKDQQGTVDKVDESLAKAKETGTKANISPDEKKQYIEAERIYQEGLASVKDLIAPASMEIQYDRIRMDGLYVQSFYVFSYPRYLEVNWLAPIINYDVTMDISQFIYPIDSGLMMKTLKKKVAQMRSSMRISAEKGNVSDPAIETALEDAEGLRTQLQRGEEKFFQYALYFTIYAKTEKKLTKITKQLESLLSGKLIMTKRAQVQAEHALNATLPLCLDELYTIRNMNTGPLSTTFPFTSSDLTS
ncbi:MAG: hypothetical protein O3B47_03625, partial [bacterium]|nr:hypothetical protein [bacterium]